MLPEGWKLSCLGDACSGALQTGPFGSQLHAHEYTEHGISVLMPKDLINYRANVETAAKISIEKSEELKRHHLKFGDILFSRRGDVARLALIDDNSKDSLCGTGCLRARPSTKNFAGFLFFFLQLPTIKSWLEHNAVGQTMPNMNTEILYELPLILPPLPEQKKIAAILSTWDRAIEGTEKLLANSQQQKKALMQQLLTGKKRLPGFTGEWPAIALRHALKEEKTPSVKNPQNIELLTVKLHHKGTIPSGKYPRLSERGRTYHVRHSGTLIIGRQNLHNGGVAIVSDNCDGLIASNAISSFSSHREYSVIFLYFLMCTNVFMCKIDTLTGGTGQKEVSNKDLLSIKWRIPPLPEQKAIAAVLSTADEEITALESDLSRLHQEKKALMQQLLTGKRRVTVD
ncbi:restriction endonuclease subunit S [Gluconobacter oxydans]|uniref:restriction endonuclease subunit S n=1 Tax=Gluconobacter oxydans TaxID=442 RepID=UPI0020A009E3|nr:restriction endonuclease subunit S [Gluconobacter oxydans]MCP1249848.1 restriction endonuclease subunit S [Gluconobacter oxydans]